MSKQTTTLRYILKSKIGLTESVGYSQVKNVIEQARPLIFDFDYPIFDQNYKSVLETKFLRHFYTREIGVTPVGKWKLWLEDELNIIMPYYNQLYESALLKFDPLKNTEQSRTGNRKDNGNSSSKANQTASGTTDSNNTVSVDEKSLNAYQDTPQSSLTGVETLTYLTNATQVTDNSTTSDNGKSTSSSLMDSTGSNEFTSLNEYSETVFGKVGDSSYSALLNEFRSTFLNIDQMVLKDLSVLFMGIYTGGDLYD